LPLKIKKISSDNNPNIKELFNKKDELYIFEGIKLIKDLIIAGLPPDLILIKDDYKDSIDLTKKNCKELWYVSEKIIKKISSLKNPPPLIAMYEKLPESDIFFDNPVIFAMDNIQDPGNMGSVFRCAAAFGIKSIALIGNCVKLTNTKFLRTSQNSVFYITTKWFESMEFFLKETKKYNFKIFMTTSHKREKLTPIDRITIPAAIILGSEGSGIDEKFFKEYPTISIIQTPLVESLNAGISGCILMNKISEIFNLFPYSK